MKGGAQTERILSLEDVTVSFDGFLALNHLNFSLERGELRFVIGPNGAGKTTFLDVITGKVRPTHGKVLFAQTIDLVGRSTHEIAMLGIGRKFQTPSIFPSHSVYENMRLALHSPRGVTQTLVSRTAAGQKEKIDSLLALVGLQTEARRPAGFLSHGQKQWLEIGLLVAQDPQLLLLDEPAAGMSFAERERTVELIRTIAARHSVVVIEHDMEFVRRLARTVSVLHEGSLLCEGTMEEVQSDPVVIEVYLGRSLEGETVAAD